MTAHDRTIELAQWIDSVLSESILLPQSVQDYMAGTFGSSDLAQILETADSSEIDSLLELIFYPDFELKIRYEDRWGDTIFGPQDQEAVIASVCATPLTVNIIISADGSALPIDLPDFVIEAFIQRLRIDWQPSAVLKTCLARRAHHRHITRIRVHLRDARLSFHTGQVKLIDRFLEKMPSDAKDFESSLAFLLEIIPELAQDGDHYAYLTAKKFFFFQSLCKAEDFERKRQSSNMEIMILQGNRAAHGNIDQWRRQMRQTDRICRTLFGRTQFFQQPDARAVDLGSGETAQRIADIMRQLT
jgi:hypothetical protein